jgi:ABC-type multidrug transport system fused ATPase/permease subunit
MIHDLFVRPILAQRQRLVILLLALLILGISESFFLINVRGFIRVLFHDARVTLVPLADLLPESVVRHAPELSGVMLPARELAVYVPLVILVAGLLKSIATYFYQLHQQALSLLIAKNYRDRLFAALIALPYVEIKKRPAGEWMSLIMNDVMLLQTRFSDLMTALVKDTFLLLACYLALAVVHWPSALLLLGCSPFIAFSLGRSGKRIAFFTEAFQKELARMAGSVLDLRARFEFVRSQGAEAREAERFGRLTRGYFEMMRRSLLLRAAFSPLLEFLGFAFFAGFVWAVGRGYWVQDFTPGLLMQFFVALGLLFRPLKEIGEQLARYHETRGTLLASLATFQRLEELGATTKKDSLNRSGEEQSSEAQLDTGSSIGWTIEHIRGGFFGVVRFQASNIQIVPGKSIAVIGPSGAGKSTLIRTLAGLIDPIEWQASVPWHEAIGHVSFVSQEPFLFQDTLRVNLTYGLDPNGDCSDRDLWQALATVNIDHEVRRLPNGLDTQLHAVGSNVSGGQLQRLVIARALLRLKWIWLLDEATSAIDAASEKDITERLIRAAQMERKVLIAVTHRLTWLPLYDQVWFVEGGQLMFAGAHDVLLREPRYRAFCLSEGAFEDSP